MLTGKFRLQTKPQVFVQFSNSRRQQAEPQSTKTPSSTMPCGEAKSTYLYMYNFEKPASWTSSNSFPTTAITLVFVAYTSWMMEVNHHFLPNYGIPNLTIAFNSISRTRIKERPEPVHYHVDGNMCIEDVMCRK